MFIGVPKEIKPFENRVGLTPASVREMIANLQDQHLGEERKQKVLDRHRCGRAPPGQGQAGRLCGPTSWSGLSAPRGQ